MCSLVVMLTGLVLTGSICNTRKDTIAVVGVVCLYNIRGSYFLLSQQSTPGQMLRGNDTRVESLQIKDNTGCTKISYGSCLH
jgi:hypothetical protein